MGGAFNLKGGQQEVTFELRSPPAAMTGYEIQEVSSEMRRDES